MQGRGPVPALAGASLGLVKSMRRSSRSPQHPRTGLCCPRLGVGVGLILTQQLLEPLQPLAPVSQLSPSLPQFPHPCQCPGSTLAGLCPSYSGPVRLGKARPGRRGVCSHPQPPKPSPTSSPTAPGPGTAQIDKPASALGPPQQLRAVSPTPSSAPSRAAVRRSGRSLASIPSWAKSRRLGLGRLGPLPALQRRGASGLSAGGWDPDSWGLSASGNSTRAPATPCHPTALRQGRGALLQGRTRGFVRFWFCQGGSCPRQGLDWMRPRSSQPAPRPWDSHAAKGPMVSAGETRRHHVSA